MTTCKRGQLVWVANDFAGGDKKPNRPAVIVSADSLNEQSDHVEIVYLTTQEKERAPWHVTIDAVELSTALCESVYTVAKSRLGSLIRWLAGNEMKAIEDGLRASLCLPADGKQTDAKLEAERDVYRDLYLQLVERFL